MNLLNWNLNQVTYLNVIGVTLIEEQIPKLFCYNQKSIRNYWSWLNRYLLMTFSYCRVYYQSGFLCAGFLQLVVIQTPLVFPGWVLFLSISSWNIKGFLQMAVTLTPLVFPDWILFNPILHKKIRGFYSWQSYWLHCFSSLKSNLIILLFFLQKYILFSLFQLFCVSPRRLPQSRVGG